MVEFISDLGEEDDDVQYILSVPQQREDKPPKFITVDTSDDEEEEEDEEIDVEKLSDSDESSISKIPRVITITINSEADPIPGPSAFVPIANVSPNHPPKIVVQDMVDVITLDSEEEDEGEEEEVDVKFIEKVTPTKLNEMESPPIAQPKTIVIEFVSETPESTQMEQNLSNASSISISPPTIIIREKVPGKALVQSNSIEIEEPQSPPNKKRKIVKTGEARDQTPPEKMDQDTTPEAPIPSSSGSKPVLPPSKSNEIVAEAPVPSFSGSKPVLPPPKSTEIVAKSPVKVLHINSDDPPTTYEMLFEKTEYPLPENLHVTSKFELYPILERAKRDIPPEQEQPIIEGLIRRCKCKQTGSVPLMYRYEWVPVQEEDLTEEERASIQVIELD